MRRNATRPRPSHASFTTARARARARLHLGLCAALCASVHAPANGLEHELDRAASPDVAAVADDRTTSPSPTFPRFGPTLDGRRSPTSIGAGWRHEFDLVLSADGGDRTVHDADGRRHEFVPLGDGSRSRYVATTAGSGTLERIATGHRWRRADGSEVDFAGSLAHAIRDGTGRTLDLRYGIDGRLGRVVDTHTGGMLRFVYDRDRRLREIRRDDGTVQRVVLEARGSLLTRTVGPPECRATDPVSPLDRAPRRCDGAANPPGDAFLGAAGLPGALRIDARPASCRSYFTDFSGTERGFEIESGLGADGHYAGYEPTVRSFPIVDFVGAELRVVRSRDLSLPTYANAPDALYRRLLADGEAIAARLLEPLERDGRIDVTELGRTTTLAHDPSRPVVLELVVRHGLASADHALQIERARAALLAARGIALRVIEIP